jgi:hypothetical protein
MVILKQLFNLTFYIILLINGLIMVTHSFFGLNNLFSIVFDQVSKVNIAGLF